MQVICHKTKRDQDPRPFPIVLLGRGETKSGKLQWMLELLGDSAPDDVYGFLQRDHATLSLSRDIVLRSVPALMHYIDQTVVTTDRTSILRWADETAKFIDPMDVSRLLRASINVYLKAWQRRHGIHDLSSIANILYRAQCDVSEKFFRPDAINDGNERD